MHCALLSSSQSITCSLLGLGLGLSGCSASVHVGSSTPSAGPEALQKVLTQKLTEKGVPPQSVTCTGSLAGEVGKTADCDVIFDDGTKSAAVLTATGVEGDTVNFDYTVTAVLTPDQVAGVLARKLEADTGIAPDTVECVDDVLAAVGNVVECTATAGDETVTYEMTVSNIEDGTASFDYKPKAKP